jgi:hypothetical protein
MSLADVAGNLATPVLSGDIPVLSVSLAISAVDDDHLLDER